MGDDDLRRFLFDDSEEEFSLLFLSSLAERGDDFLAGFKRELLVNISLNLAGT